MKKYGLIGKDISYSLSPFIHNFLISKYNLNANYEIVDVKNINEIDFNKYDGLNVTMPYKEEVLKYFNDKSNLGIVNTLKEKEAFNTDIKAFDEFFKKHIKEVSAVAILGNSATSKMLKKYFATSNIKVFVFSRNNGISYDEFLNYDFDFLINTTPLGQGKYKGQTPIDYSILKKKKLKYVLDFNYNPINTKLLIDCKKLNIKSFSGLEILVLQAIYSFEIFTKIKVDKKYIDELLLRCNIKLANNTILYGMPLSGKSNIYKSLKKYKRIYDLDLEIEKITKLSNYNFIKSKGIKEFREIESQVIQRYLKIPNSIIIVGGGFLTNLDNFDLIQDINLIYYDVSLKRLCSNYKNSKNKRPLIKNYKDLIDLYTKRKNLYENAFNISEIKKENLIKMLKFISKNNLL